MKNHSYMGLSFFEGTPFGGFKGRPTQKLLVVGGVY